MGSGDRLPFLTLQNGGKSMTTFSRTVFVAGVMALSTSSLIADEPSKPVDSNRKESQVPFLGVYVTSMHPALAHHLRDTLGQNQGLLVEQVDENSAAGKAGIKEHDILTTYDDQKLFSAEQLAKLVHSDQVGREVSVGYLRDGKQEKTQLKLQETKEHSRQSWMTHHGDMQRRLRQHERSMAHGRNDSSDSDWQTFDSLTLKRLKDNKLHAEVQYLDKDGKIQKHVFEGTRDELRKSIHQEKEMKPVERRHLLRTLGLWDHDNDRELSHSLDSENWLDGPLF